MTKKTLLSLFPALVALVLLGSAVFAKSEEQKGATKGLRKTTTDDQYNYIDINQVLRWISNNGDGSFDPNTGVAGCYWPKGTSNTCVYEDGLVYGGFVTGGTVNHELRLTGSTYRHPFQAGRIVTGSDGKPTGDDPTKDIYRIFKIRKDFHSFAASDPRLYSQLKKDYLEWPGDQGAPYVDMNGDGQFQPPQLDANDNLIGGDAPQFLGDEVLWHVSNDMNAGKSKFVYGSAGLGIEIQRTLWGYALTGAMGNAWFERYRLINKGGLQIDSMYIGLWSDTDLGGGAKDLSGCDTSLQLGFTWNGGDAAAGGPYSVPIADGYVLLQGPKAPGASTDSANFNFQKVAGFKNQRMTAYVYYINGSSVLRDPTFDLNGTLQFYRYLNGLVWDGTPFIDPTTQQATKFTLWGDPVANTGWVDGLVAAPADRRHLIATGPVTMMPGDTQEVLQAFNVQMGGNKLQSVSLLKNAAKVMKTAYDLKFNLPSAPPAPIVSSVGLQDKVVLDWSNPVSSSATESSSFSILGTTYAFQGYNVYQIPTPTATKDQAKRLATFDIVDSVTTITNPVFDPATGLTLEQVSQMGSNSKIQRYYVVDHDYLTGGPFVKGRNYYFVVTSYSYNATPPFGSKDLENQFSGNVITVVLQDPPPGSDFPSKPLAQTPMALSAGTASADVSATVVDPTKMTGSDYKVTFQSSGNTQVFYTSYGTGNNLDTLNVPNVTKFSVVRVSDGTTIVSGNTNLAGDISSPVADGIQWKVTGFPTYQQYNEIKAVNYTPTANNNLSSILPAYGFPDALYGVMPGESWVDQIFFGGDRHGLESYKDTNTVEVRFADPADTVNMAGWSKGYGYLALVSHGTPSHVDPTTGKTRSNRWWTMSNSYGSGSTYQYTGYWNSPVSFWDVSDTTHPRQLSWAFWEQDSMNGPYTTKYLTTDTVWFRDWRGGSAPDSLIYARYYTSFHPGDTLLYRPWVPNPDLSPSNQRQFKFPRGASNLLRHGVFFVLNENYAKTPNPLYMRTMRGGFYDASAQTTADLALNADGKGPGKMPLMYAGQFGYKSITKPAWNKGDKMTIVPNRPLTPSSIFQFKAGTIPAGAVTGNNALAKASVDKINVYPNPYFGVNSQEVNKYQRFVTFSHLPTKATIRIFNLAGVLVNTIVKNDASTFTQWNLRNANGLPVASGMYIAYIDLGDTGTKVLKLAVIMEAQFLDRL